MLQKDPASRPSASDLSSKYLPSLFEPEEMELSSVNQEDDVIENTERK